MLDLKTLREAAGGLPDLADEEIIGALYPAFKGYYKSVDDFAKSVGYEGAGRGKWGSRGSAAVDNYQANLYGIAEAAGAGDWARRGRERNEAAADYARSRASELGAISSYKDVGGVGDALDYVGGLAVDSAPYIAEAFAGGGGAALVARGLGRLAARQGAGAVTRGLSRIANASPAVTRTAGAVGAGYASAVGDILSNQREQAGTTDLGSAAGLGVPYALLNAGLGIEGRIARGTLARNTLGKLDKIKGLPGGLARTGMSAATTAATEGVSEAGQEVINQLGRMAVDPAATLTDPAAIERYKESLVGGAVLGGAFGGAAGGWRRSKGYQAEKPPLPDQDADLLQDWQRNEIPAVNRKNPGFDPYAQPRGLALGDYVPGEQAGPVIPEDLRRERMLGGFDPGFADAPVQRDGLDYTFETDTSGLSLAPIRDPRPEYFELGYSMPADQVQGEQGPLVQGADPNQQEMFFPNGEPTYNADRSFSAPELLEAPSPEFGFSEYSPRPPGLDFAPDIDTSGLSLLPRTDPRQVDWVAGEAVTPTAQQQARPDFQLEAQDPGVQGELDFGALPTEAQTPQTEFPGNNPMRRNQRGFVDDLPFAPPEAKIKTPLGQQLFTTADSLVQEGFMDEGTFDQVTTMLAQNKFGAAAKLVNASLGARNDVQRTLDMTVGKAQEEQQKAEQEQVKQQEAAAQEAEKAATELGKKVLTEPMTTDGRTMDDIQRQVADLEQQRRGTLRADGRLPNQGTAKRKQHDALADQIDSLKQEWSRLDVQAQKAKKAGGEKQAAGRQAQTAKAAPEQQAKVSKYERLIACLRP